MHSEQDKNWLENLVELVKTNFEKQLKKSQKFKDSERHHSYNDDSRINIQLFDTKNILFKIRLDYYKKNVFSDGKIIRFDEDAKTSIKFKNNVLSNHMKKMIELINSTTFTYVDVEYVPMRYIYDGDISIEDSYHTRAFVTKKQIQKYENMWLELGIIIDWNNWKEGKNDKIYDLYDSDKDDGSEDSDNY